MKLINKNIERELESIVEELKKYPQVKAIFLFGSSLNGKVKPLSDIDIAVITENSTKKLEAELFGFSSKLFDVVNFHKLPLYIQFEVLKNGKLLFAEDESYLLQIKKKILKEYLDMSHMYENLSRKILS